MSSPSSADSDDRPLGQQSIHDSDSEPSENSGSDRQLSESSGNSDSDRQVIGENSHSIRRRGKRNRHVSLVSDESSPERRRRKPAVDLFTALPDSLLLHVLSFLPIEDAVKTQVLSKRCQYLWTYITSLVFSIRSAGRCDRDFVAFVDKTLVLSNCSKIKKLGVQFGYAPDYESSVDLWTQFAAGKRAEELQLAFEDANDPYLLPQLLYTNSSFKTLQFNTCDVMPEGVVRWNSLKRLSIGHAKLSEDVIQKILAGSPVLEILELYRCHGFTRLHVSNASVKKLKLRHVWVEDPSGLEISASQLHSLEVSGRLYDRICRLGNVSSLVDANLNFHERIHGPYSDDDFERYSNMLRGLLQSLVHVKKMTLGTWALQLLQVFSSVSCQVVVLDPDSIDPIHWNTPCYSMNLKLLCIMEEKGQRSPLLKCECLRLDTGIRKSVIPGIAHMLESSPDLETLVITKSSYGCHEYFRDEIGNLDGKHYWSSRKKPFTCLMFRLKQVKLIGLVKSRVDDYLTFVQFILMNARVLQKMVIDAQMRGYNWQKEFTEFPRSSPDAVVMFCQ